MKRFSLFAKNLLMFMAPVVVSLLFLTTLSTITTRSYLKRQIDSNNDAVLQSTKQNIELTLSGLEQINVNISTNPDVIFTLKNILFSKKLTLEDIRTSKIIEDFFDSYVYLNHYIDSIYIYFENEWKNLLVTENGIVQLSTFMDKSWYTEFLKNKKSEQSFYLKLRNIRKYSFETKDIKLLSLFRKLYTSGSDYNNGVVVLNLRLDQIKKLLENSKAYPEQFIALVDTQNQIISHTAAELTEKEAAGLILQTGDNAKKNLYYEVELKQYGLRLVSVVPKSVLYYIPDQIFKISLSLLLASLVLGILVACYFTWKSNFFINHLKRIIHAAKKGQELPALDKKISDEYNDIIYNLVTSFIEQNYLKVQLSERLYHQKSLELSALQYQINPHFLYNTLATIHLKALSMTGGANELSAMVENLSDLLRYSLADPLKRVTFQEEIDNTKSYIGIQQIRYRDMFQLYWEWEESLSDCRVIRLLLQPLIENSIFHGIESKGGKCGIKIRIRRNNDLIRIAVIDNGIGMTSEKLKHLKEQLKSAKDFSEEIGLCNIDKRLRLAYGEEHGLDIRSKQGVGTVIYICIPVEF